jgi:hypothetical protein
LDGLSRLPDEIIFSIENDVLYHPSRFDFMASDGAFYYQANFYNLTRNGFLKHRTGRCFSQLVVRNDLWRGYLLNRLLEVRACKRIVWAEPRYNYAMYYAKYPDVGIRHGRNYTGNRIANDQSLYIEKLPYWGDYKDLWEKIDEG